MNNVAIGYQALMACTTGSINVAVGYDALNTPYKKIIILTSKVLMDPMAEKYCYPKSKITSYIIYDSNTYFHALFVHDCWASDSYYSNSQLNDAVIQYNKMYPRWMILFLCIKVYLGDISHDILSNIMSYYINSY
jgi:hypothetical protein